MKQRVVVTVAIDTEEDNWGAYDLQTPTVENIRHLEELQALFERCGARPTYFVNRPPLIDDASVSVLRRIRDRDDVEIGGHCHPWNTPPYSPGREHISMMSALRYDENHGKIAEINRCLGAALDVTPVSFRCGRWALGPAVARALADNGYAIDCSVTPLLDWSAAGGVDFSDAPLQPYRFDPAAPLVPVKHGSMIELPATTGFLAGNQRTMAAARRRLIGPVLRRLRLAGLLDRIGLLRMRRLTPEGTSAVDMIRLVDALAAAGLPVLNITFHSCTLLPGATPYVRTTAERTAFLRRLEEVLRHCSDNGCEFRTMRETAELFRGP